MNVFRVVNSCCNCEYCDNASIGYNDVYCYITGNVATYPRLCKDYSIEEHINYVKGLKKNEAN